MALSDDNLNPGEFIRIPYMLELLSRTLTMKLIPTGGAGVQRQNHKHRIGGGRIWGRVSAELLLVMQTPEVNTAEVCIPAVGNVIPAARSVVPL